MRKLLKILCINLFLCVFIIVAIDFTIAIKNYNEFIGNIKKSYSNADEIQKDLLPEFEYSLKYSSFKKWFLNSIEYFNEFPRKIVSNAGKKSIILLGCSYAAGSFLPDDNNLATKLSKKTSRNVYNFAVEGMGPSAMLHIVKTDKTYEIIDKDVEYVFYFFIPYHISRMWQNKYGAFGAPGYVSYVQKGDSLVEEEMNFFIHQLCRMQYIREQMAISAGKNYNSVENIDVAFDLFKLYMIEIKKEVQKHYPNVKFVLVKHPSRKNVFEDEENLKLIYNSQRWKEFEDNDIMVYDIKNRIKEDLSGDEYMLPDKHPTAESWDIFVSQFVKDLNL